MDTLSLRRSLLVELLARVLMSQFSKESAGMKILANDEQFEHIIKVLVSRVFLPFTIRSLPSAHICRPSSQI